MKYGFLCTWALSRLLGLAAEGSVALAGGKRRVGKSASDAHLHGARDKTPPRFYARMLLSPWLILTLCILLGPAAPGSVALAGSADSRVHAVLFYSPICPHCHKVITEILQPLIAQYGDKLEIVGVNSTAPEGLALLQSAIRAYGIPEGRRGVPIVFIGHYILVGPEEIGPGCASLVKSLLEEGGSEFPPIPGLKEQIEKDKAQAAKSSGQSGASKPGLDAALKVSLYARLAADPVGNSIAIATLAGMLFVLGRVLISLRRSTQNSLPAGSGWPIPVLSLIGLAIAGYLAYVTMAKSVSICGPVGDCNLVQQSEYARFFGIIPVSFLGVGGYLAIIFAWALSRYGHGRIARTASGALLAAAFLGTVLSIYLTSLEPFVIGASCLWCLLSAVVMTALLWCSARRFKSIALLPDSSGASPPASKARNSTGPRKQRNAKKRH